MWISYYDSEVRKYHPVCEKALNIALKKIFQDTEYEVLHHEYTGSLEMDFIIRNIRTKHHLCVIEVKKTPADVNSARYQYQAMSYVQNLAGGGKPYYVLTNLEYAFAFRFDPTRPRVVQQMLEPGIVHIADFNALSQVDFEEKLTDYFAQMISAFIDDRYKYLATLEQFETHMRNLVNDNKKWKSSLAVLLYEYIRGAFLSIGRKELTYDVRSFRNDIQRICNEAATVNFKEIFTFSPQDFEAKATVAEDVLVNIFDFGKQSVSGDSIAGLLHSIISLGKEHDGEVPTDLELARVVAVLAKSITGAISSDLFICDPAVGSGNLVSSAADMFGVMPNQIKANDVNKRLLELLSLRIGLNYPKIISARNSAVISGYHVADLPSDYFDDVAVVVMNPPFVAGINCVERKQAILKKIRKVKGKKANTDVGQMNLEGVFLELICSLCKPNTVISCVFPKTHLVARGKEAVEIRKLLLNDFGLKAIFSYPEDGLFEDVTKGTCVLLGHVGNPVNIVKFVSSSNLVEDIDLNLFGDAISQNFALDNFASIIPGIDGMAMEKQRLVDAVKNGWRQVCREFDDATEFQQSHFVISDKLAKISCTDKRVLSRKRGSAGNNGASDLLMADIGKGLHSKFNTLPAFVAMKKAMVDTLFVSKGDTVCFDAGQISDDKLSAVVDFYMSLPKKESQQQRKEKTKDELIRLMKSTSAKPTPAYATLLPRAIRALGRAYVVEGKVVVSTNFVVFPARAKDDASILASWFTTIFYQLTCEINAKPQEGMRKMEVGDIEETFVPILSKITKEQKAEIIAEIANIEFLTLNNPTIRKIDEIWANILFGNDATVRLAEANRLLKFLANTRNPQNSTDEE